jgi:hypothetical protein
MGRRSADWWDQREKLRRFGGGIVIRTFDGLDYNLRAPHFEEDKPLRCMAYSSITPKLLSSMKIEISYYVSDEGEDIGGNDRMQPTASASARRPPAPR